ncbi:MAG: fatty-acid--CoA ligase [Campylobacterales bacterium]|nr:fatty-acid--CoA ligase [Campylobacterales bacterium]
MGIKRYILLSLVFIVAVGLYVFSFEGAQLSREFFGLSVTLPVALWVIIPSIALVLASVVHMVFYYAKAGLQERARKKDYEHFIDAAKASLLGEESHVGFKSHWFKLPAELLSRMTLKPDATAEGIEDEELRTVAEVVVRVRQGEVVELKKYKLRQDNPLVMLNKLNQLNTNPKLASEFLKNCVLDETQLCIKAFEVLLQSASYAEIKRLGRPLDETMILDLLRRHADGDDALHMEEIECEALLASPALSKQGLIKAAKILLPILNPDAVVLLFEKLYNARVEACDAFLYVLFELQMIDRVREVLENSDKDDLVKFKLLLFLRDHGKHCDTSLFV